MTLFNGPEQHAANPPETWQIVRSGRRWLIATSGDTLIELASFTSKREAGLVWAAGDLVVQYHRETRWYAGETIPGYQPYDPAIGTAYLPNPNTLVTRHLEQRLIGEMAIIKVNMATMTAAYAETRYGALAQSLAETIAAATRALNSAAGIDALQKTRIDTPEKGPTPCPPYSTGPT